MTAPSNVYTNKDGKATDKHLWFIEEADPYVAPLNAADYADRTNLVVNGDFQAEGYEQGQKDGQLTLSALPGWTELITVPKTSTNSARQLNAIPLMMLTFTVLPSGRRD